MSNNMPAEGKHRARCTSKPFYAEPSAEGGALMVHIPCELPGTNPVYTGTAKVAIIKKDGSPMQKSIVELGAIFGIEDLSDPFFLDAVAEFSKEFEVTAKHSDFTPEGSEHAIPTCELSWPTRIGGAQVLPVTADTRKSILANHGTKFRALFGGKPAAAPAKEAKAKKAAAPAQAELPTSAPAATPKVSGPPRKPSDVARTSSQEEVWNALEKKNNEAETPMDGDSLAEKYYAAQHAVRAGMEFEGVGTPEEWGKVANGLGL